MINGLECRRVYEACSNTALFLTFDEPGTLKHAKVLGECRECHRMGFCKLTDRRRPIKQPLDDCKPRWIAQSMKARV